MTLMVLGAMGTTVGAGTFASFNASTTQGASTFKTGSVVLSNDKSGTTCYSTGGGSTDSNANGACTALFLSGSGNNAGIKRPGEVATVDLTLQNVGSVTSLLTGYMPTACTDTDVAGATYNGTASPCQNLQMSIQEYGTAARSASDPSRVCRYGSGASAVITATTALTASIVITATTNLFKFTADGVTFDNVALTAATYTPATLATEVQTRIRLKTGKTDRVALTTANKLQISSPKTGTLSNYTISTPTTSASSGLAKLGFTTGTTATGNALDCTLSSASPDNAHTLTNYLADYPSGAAGVPIGSLSSNQSRYLRITLVLPVDADNLLQGRKATFSLSWTLIQS